eukprot:g10710.t1
MEDAAADETETGLEPEPQPFSVVLAPPATVAVSARNDHGGVLLRYLCARKPQHQHARDRAGSRGSTKRPSSGLSSIVMAVRAQPHALHLYRGRKLCRVIEFPSAVLDVAGLPRRSASTAPRADTLCVAVCRDGRAYALPAAEVLEGAEQGGTSVNLNHSGRAKSIGDAAIGAAPAGASEGKPGSSRSSSSPAAVGIFDELAPTILDDSQPQEPLSPELAATQKHQDNGANGSGGGARVSLGGLVVQAQERWALFSHQGVRTVSVCGDGLTTAVAGIIDRAASYSIAAETGEGGGVSGAPPTAARRLGTLAGADGTAPTTSCVVWMEDGTCGGGAVGDGKGFPLPSALFRSLFGGYLSAPSSQPVHGPAADVRSKPAFRMTASVVLIGDTAGTVRWSPVRPRPGCSGGILASVPGETTAVVAVLPQLDAESRAVGVLVVGANGTVLNLAATTAGAASPGDWISRKRSRPDDAGEHHRREGGGGGSACATADRRVPPPPPSPPHSVLRRLLGLPFPVSSACSVPGFLVHCHAGALFATAVPVVGGGGEQDEARRPPAATFGRSRTTGPNDVAADELPLRPVRLPLPCDAVGVAVAPVLAGEDEVGMSGAPAANSSAAGGARSAVRRRALVVSLSGQGRLVGFMAPRSVEELEGWRLDAGKGGVRVGSSAGVERRVRGQLERLSSLGRQCAALSAESAERDREIGVLRGATLLLPPLVASAGRRMGAAGGGSGGRGGTSASSGSLAHSVSMVPDTQGAAAGFADSFGGEQGPGQSDALQVRLCLRLWPREGGCARGDLQAVGGDDDGHGGGRWFIVARLVAEGGGGTGGTTGGGFSEENADNVGEGWAWSTSALVPMGSLRQGWPWSSSVAVSLPSARPVTATSWLQFRFDGNGGRKKGPIGEASGVCVELGRSRFDVLDWGVKLSSVPRSAAAVRAASRGPGSIFCGPELAIAGVLEGPSSSCARNGSVDGALQVGSAAARPAVPAAWSSFRVRLASPDHDAGTLLSLLVPASTAPPAASDRNGVGGVGGSGGGARAEIAIRVAGQVAIIRAADCTGAAGAAGERGGHSHTRAAEAAAAAAAAGSRDVELAVTCSHAAMAPLVREALLDRARLLPAAASKDDREPESRVGGGGSGSGGAGRISSGGVVARGDAAARLVREIHPIKQAVTDASDAARALGAARASDGPSAESSAEALALMYRVGEIYQNLRRRQESVAPPHGRSISLGAFGS